MKTSQKLLKFGLIIILYLSYFNIKAQNNSEKEKLDALINLFKFIDWYPSQNNHNKLLFIYTDGNSSSFEHDFQSKKSYKYKGWQVICSDLSSRIVNNSLVFVTQEKKDQTSLMVRLSEERNVLLVGDNIDQFCENGGMINMINNNGSTSFEINYTEIQNRNIEISTKLLTLSKIL